MAITLTVRRTGKTERTHFASLDAAFEALEAALGVTERRGTVKAFARDVEPVRQVVARAELKGPGGVRGGVDVRGDGSTEAFTGWWRKQPVEQHPGEDAVRALRRVLAS